MAGEAGSGSGDLTGQLAGMQAVLLARVDELLARHDHGVAAEVVDALERRHITTATTLFDVEMMIAATERTLEGLRKQKRAILATLGDGPFTQG